MSLGGLRDRLRPGLASPSFARTELAAPEYGLAAPEYELAALEYELAALEYGGWGGPVRWI